jgi:glycosyltransferase involved in cell wall biosynthesis
MVSADDRKISMSHQPLHVALLSAEYPPMPGGVGDYTRQLGAALMAAQVRVTAISGASNAPAPDGPPVYRLPLRTWGWALWGALARALAELQPDVIHIQYQTGAYGMHPAVNLLPLALRLRRPRPQIIVTAHDLLVPYLFPKAGPLRTWVTRRLLADSAAAIVTNREDFVQAEGFRPRARRLELVPIGSNIAVAPPAGFDRAAWRARLGVAPDAPLVAFFGLISRTKGVATLLDALAILNGAPHLLIIGGAAANAEDQEFAAAAQQRIAALGLGGRVMITGHAAEEEVSAHLLAADLVALPFTDGASFRRGSLLAALAHGVPVVTTSLGGEVPAPDGGALRDGENALLVPPNDPAALAAAIVRLRSDPRLAARIGAGGRALAQRFGWDTIAAQHIRLYHELVGARRAA